MHRSRTLLRTSSCYATAAGMIELVTSLAVNDIAATELVFAVNDKAALHAIAAENRDACISGPVTCKDGPTRALFRDPDGHLLCLESRSTDQAPARFQPRARLP